MGKSRLEAFSDGVIAIIITIMVLELKVPHGSDWSSLIPLLPVFLSYILSYVFIGIYWGNHHHLLHALKFVNGKTVWLNLHLLLWLSLIPFVTGWFGESYFAPLPTALYGVVLLGAGIAYYFLQLHIVHQYPWDSPFALALGHDRKGPLALLIYSLSIPAAYLSVWISIFFYIFIAAIYFMPERRIEKNISKEH